jgi:sialic acid synthase SpsE/CMP-N-acetylneuraminic acid synthetase
MEVLLLITARGGSKGIPGKNLRTVAGIPLVGRAARTARLAAKALGHGARVVCSTDDKRIATAAGEWGAEVPFLRPRALATDRARSADVVFHALEALNEKFDAVVLLQPTSPLTEAGDICGALALFRRTSAPVISVCASEHPAEWFFTMGRDGRLERLFDGTAANRRQDAARTFRPNGAIYIASPAQLGRNDGFYAADARGFVMPAERSFDIDTPRDLSAANALLASRPVAPIEIAGRKVGPGHPCFIIAEAGVNHNGSLDLALKLVDAAADAGADAVKFQLYNATEQASRAARTAAYQKARTGSQTMLDMAKTYDLPWKEHRQIARRCRARGIHYMASCFDRAAVEFLLSIGGDCLKVGSGEITNLPLLGSMAGTGKPILLSTGMSDIRDVATAVDHIRSAGPSAILLFQCVSNYPALHKTLNLSAMQTMQRAFGIPVGFSDHSVDATGAAVAVGLGACAVEKHFTLDRSLPGPDHMMSLTPAALREYVNIVHRATEALGDGEKRMQPSETATRRAARRSLVAARAIRAGERLTNRNVTIKRPATGIDPREWELVKGRVAAIDIPDDEPITRTMIR